MKQFRVDEMSKSDFEYFVEQILKKVLSEQLSQTENYKPSESNKYYSRKETANLLKISLVTLSKLTSSGMLKSFRLGSKRVLYKHSDIENALISITPNILTSK